MVRSYRNKAGIEYFLPEYGPPVRWFCCSTEPPLDDDLPSLYYFECDAGNLGCRAIHVYASGRVMLAYPGGPYGEYLPEGELPPKGKYDVLEGFCREMTETEFNLLWLALDVSDPNT